MFGRDVTLRGNAWKGHRPGLGYSPADIQIHAYPYTVLCCFPVSPRYVLAIVSFVKIGVSVSKLYTHHKFKRVATSPV